MPTPVCGSAPIADAPDTYPVTFRCGHEVDYRIGTKKERSIRFHRTAAARELCQTCWDAAVAAMAAQE